MKKLIASLATVVLMVGSLTNVTAKTYQAMKIPAPYIDPGIPTKGQQEANQINYDRVTLNDTPIKSYLNTTAEQDKSVIEQQLEANQELDPKTAGDFTFDNTTPLKWYVKNRITYHTQTSDGSKGRGVLDVYVNPYTPSPTPTPHKKASKLTPSNPKASIIGPSNLKASIIGPSQKEDAEDIANKLFMKKIKLDPDFWLGKNIKDYTNQFNGALIKQGLLNQEETQYISWSNVNITSASYFSNAINFTVQKDKATAKGYASINATTGETTNQIATKLKNADIRLNYNYWNNKTINSLSTIKSILVNEKILTKAEASVLVGVNNNIKINKIGVIPVIFKLNDQINTTKTIANLNVVNDGKTDEQIKNDLQGNFEDLFALKTNTIGQYADSATVMKNFHNLLVDDYNMNVANADDITLMHQKLQAGKNNIPAQINKDGRIINTKIDIFSANKPYNSLDTTSDNNFKLYVNLTPVVINDLKTFFSNNPNPSQRLGYFYQVLNDGDFIDQRLPKDASDYFDLDNCLNLFFNSYGYFLDNDSQIAAYQADCSNKQNKNFEEQLVNEVNNSNGDLSVMFNWEYKDTQGSIDRGVYTTKNYKFW